MSPAETIIVTYEPLKKFATEAFSKTGLSLTDAETVASVLTWANLRGSGFPRRAVASLVCGSC